MTLSQRIFSKIRRKLNKVSKVNTTLLSVSFNYDRADRELFESDQQRQWHNIEDLYRKLRSRCLLETPLPVKCSPKEWLTTRCRFYETNSLMRLLYLTESFRDSAKKFNAVAAAIHIKAMVEIPMRLGYLVWILDKCTTFPEARKELEKFMQDTKDQESGLTRTSVISQKEFYSKADSMIHKFLKDDPEKINLLERLYKNANATGHQNYEALMMTMGYRADDVRIAADRKKLFVLYSKIFQFFTGCGVVMSTTYLFSDAIDHYLNQLPESVS